ncbi:MAG: hypothetical protein ACXWRE_11720 [Pseudobdellovibrionaceae bacterium]
MKINLRFISVVCFASGIYSSASYSKTFQQYAGAYKINSANCGDTQGSVKACNQDLIGKELAIVMAGNASNIPCVQLPGMQYCMNNTAGVSANEAQYDSGDGHGTLRYNIEMKDDGATTTILTWRFYDNPTYGKNPYLSPMDNKVIYTLEKK